jgi:type IV pilus assembly protein PilN
VNAQEERNAFVRGEIAALEKEIAEIQKLKQQTEALLSRKRVIESLQSNRTQTVHLFNELAKHVPEGVYLKSLKQADLKLTLTGSAQSNARVTTLMNNLDESPLLASSRLIETKAETAGGRRLNAFTIETMIVNQTTDAAKVGTKK